ncbi:S8 family serine peptidase [Halobaculum magnesiiphilum]|uniref:S8 family serine peptidase n=1 Tax=Halobaculum magnesiiphilum TaxID=1017351 RepID=A0A8T8WFT2_9EURY|nr:S8 family serine peptidase [Halobaculum magnesiiphilum]QZP38700.1 S8 family serine peptidase [Halobaculum magnesiiphilum]
MPRHGRRTFLKVSGGVLGGLLAGSTVTAAERTDRYVVKTKGKKTPTDLEVVHDLSEIGYAVVRASESDVKRSKAVKSFAPDVELDVSDPTVRTRAYEGDAEDDDLYPYQWDKQALDVPTAHETTKGEGTRVAIIDSGVDASHPDLVVNEELSRDFTGDGLGAGVPGGGDHGTHVAGIAAAQTAGTTGVAGTAPATDLVDYRVFSEFGGTNGSFATIVAAVLRAVEDGCDVANLSLGAYPIPRQGLGSFYGGVLNKAMTYANKEGTLLVVAAGNDSADLQHDKNLISLPNEGAQALSVAATGPIGFADALVAGEELESPPESPAFYTNYGTNAVDLGAPGGDADTSLTDPVGGVPAYAYDLVFNTVTTVLTDDDGNYAGSVPGYGWKAGTSMAAPNVAGAAALVKSANPEYDANQVESALRRAAAVPDGYDKTYYGAGFLNVVDAL